jgi:error-prone DNA polymerase
MTNYAELGVTTNYSFLRGASHPRELIDEAVRLGLDAIGIADRNSLAGVVRAYDALRQHPPGAIRLLVGARLVFADGTPDILAYPRDREAYGRLSQLLTQGKFRAKKGDCILRLDDLLGWREGLLLIVMPGEIPKALIGQPDVWLAATMPFRGRDRAILRRRRRLARETGLRLIALNDVLYHAPERRPLQDVVTCIREHKTIESAGRLLQANAERHLKEAAEMTRLFQAAPEAIAETMRFAARINFTLDDLKYNYPHEPVPPGKTADGHLRDLTWAGAARRYPQGVPAKLRETLQKELAIIADRKYAHYFLTVHDIVAFANTQNILCQGRGSAANSAVCYVLGITAVDPLQIDLLFERFVSEKREEPPDIDVDFEHERREEVIQHVYQRYGHHRAALTATVICYRPRSAIREVGKVFGLTEDVTGAIRGSVWGSHKRSLDKREVRQGDLDPENQAVARAAHFANELIGFPRHLSQHVGGFVLTEDRLDSIVPIGPAAMDDRYFIEWDKDDLDTLRIMKVDVLALGMLTCIRKAFDMIAAHEGRRFDLATVPREDARVYDMLCKADAIGVFQVESRAQMSMLPRLRPREFYDLVVEVAIVRPGPIQGDMVHPYLRRRSGKEKIDFPAPDPRFGPRDELFQVLHKTMGVPLFQEQAMKLAIVAAEFTPDESNGLRRAMATFRNLGTIESFKAKFLSGMTRRGYDPAFAQRCFKQIEGFGSYGFPESHAASFAHLVYISAWIKCFHPAAFGASLLNSQPMGFYAPAEIVRDARDHGVEVLAPDVGFGSWDNDLVRREALALRLGFRQIDGFREAWAQSLLDARGSGFADFGDFVRRTGLPKRALMVLAEADAFRSLGLDRREALWAVRRLPDNVSLPLFEHRAPDQAAEHLAPLPVMQLSEHVLADYQTMRLSLKGYPTQFLRALFQAERISSCAEILAGRDGRAARCAGIVLVRQMPGGSGVVFVTLSDETGVANVVIWPSILEQFRKEVMGARLLLVEGRIQKSPEGVVHLVAERLFDRSRDLQRLQEEPAQAAMSPHVMRHPRNVRIVPRSRDFH